MLYKEVLLTNNILQMNKSRIIAVTAPVDGQNADGTWSYVKVTLQKKQLDNSISANEPVTRNFFRDNKKEAPLYLAVIAHITKYAAEANAPANLATLPDVNGTPRSEVLPKGQCFYVTGKDGEVKTYATGEDKGKQIIGNRFTTFVLDGPDGAAGEDFDQMRDAFVASHFRKGTMVKPVDIAEYHEPKAKRLYADMLAELKRIEALETTALPE